MESTGHRYSRALSHFESELPDLAPDQISGGSPAGIRSVRCRRHRGIKAGTVSIFNGPKPATELFDTAQDEIEGVGRWISARRSEGMAPEEIGVFVRGDEVLSRARQAVEHSGESGHELSARAEEGTGSIAFGPMHLAKGLEFRAVVVMACDDGVLPLEDRLDSVTEESDLEEIYETERRLFYVACTRARDMLLVTAIAPGSVFLRDIDDEG